MKLAIIIALDSHNGISKNNEIPWKIKEDTNFFQDVTKRSENGKLNAVIMGKTTFLSLSNEFGLKDRINVVVSTTLVNDKIHVRKNLKEAISFCQTLDIGKIFICGGKNIYDEAILNHNIDELYLTRINHNFECDNKVEFLPKYINTFFKLHNSYEYKLGYYTVNFYKYSVDHPYDTKNLKNSEELQYLNLLESVIKNGHFRQTRNSKTWSSFGKNLEFDLSKGFPIITTKKVFLRGVFEELLFFLKADTNANHLSEKGVKIWDPNTSREFLDSQNLNYKVGDMGPMYGFQFCHCGENYVGMEGNYDKKGFNQIEYCLNLLKTDPFSRRIIMTSFNPSQAKEGVLYPCHGIVIQFYVEDDNKLSCAMYQRSADLTCGIPFNIASYALLVHMFCEVLGNFKVGRLIISLGDVHIYEDHYSNVIRQILRDPYPFPKLVIKNKVKNLTDFKFEDFELVDYNTYPNINYKMVA